MKFFLQIVLLALLVLLTTFTIAAEVEHKAVIVSYPDTTPDSVLKDAKSSILSAGGSITHEYKLIKAFAAKASEKTLKSVQALGAKYNALVEEDKQVHAQGGAF